MHYLSNLPVDVRRPCRLRAFIDSADQSSALSSGILPSEEILQIAGWSKHYRAAVKDVMHEAYKLSRGFGNKAMNRLIVIEETSPVVRVTSIDNAVGPTRL
jgi:hypothetical protein